MFVLRRLELHPNSKGSPCFVGCFPDLPRWTFQSPERFAVFQPAGIFHLSYRFLTEPVLVGSIALLVTTGLEPKEHLEFSLRVYKWGHRGLLAYCSKTVIFYTNKDLERFSFL